jgi:hypothetical protein
MHKPLVAATATVQHQMACWLSHSPHQKHSVAQVLQERQARIWNLRDRRGVGESQQGWPAYLSATLDSPLFQGTINARLVEAERGMHNLIWSCSKGQ